MPYSIDDILRARRKGSIGNAPEPMGPSDDKMTMLRQLLEGRQAGGQQLLMPEVAAKLGLDPAQLAAMQMDPDYFQGIGGQQILKPWNILDAIRGRKSLIKNKGE